MHSTTNVWHLLCARYSFLCYCTCIFLIWVFTQFSETTSTLRTLMIFNHLLKKVILVYFSFWFFLCVFFFKILFMRENGEKGRERGRSRLYTVQWAQCRARWKDPEIMTWAKTKSWMLHWLSHPGTSDFIVFLLSKKILVGQKHYKGRKEEWNCLSGLEEENVYKGKKRNQY